LSKQRLVLRAMRRVLTLEGDIRSNDRCLVKEAKGGKKFRGSGFRRNLRKTSQAPILFLESSWMLPQKQTCPPALRPTGTKVGDGSSPCSLSHADIRRVALAGGCRLPDAILHGKRSFRPR